MKRIAVIYAENDVIGDRMFTPLLAQTLHRYADMIQNQEAGHTSPEIYEDPNGTHLTILGGAWEGGFLPSPLPPEFRFKHEEQQNEERRGTNGKLKKNFGRRGKSK
ncbi:hypothetical protein [Brenneria uluponensis]|uniref:hypothetical protein n=1 Tax=Brenneria uluponensis TaxID=3057057 RepID=UPI0028EB7ABB|nr:hypothetical protein [Brenneria ulupoensis]